MTPPLLLVFGVAPLAAVGTELWFAAIARLFATRVHHGHDLIDWPVAERLWLGVLVTLTSVGAGALGAVFLAYLPLPTATDIVHATALAIFVGLGHLLIGNVDFGFLGNLLVGSIPAAIVGALLSARLPHALLRGAPAVVLLCIGVNLWWSMSG